MYFYLVIVGHDPAESFRVTLNYLTYEINVIARDTKLALIITFLPSILPQPREREREEEEEEGERERGEGGR